MHRRSDMTKVLTLSIRMMYLKEVEAPSAVMVSGRSSSKPADASNSSAFNHFETRLNILLEHIPLVGTVRIAKSTSIDRNEAWRPFSLLLGNLRGSLAGQFTEAELVEVREHHKPSFEDREARLT